MLTKPDDAPRNWREAHAALVQTCPPCTGNCNQGRICPAREDDQSTPLTLGEKPYLYGGIVIAFVGFCSGVLWLCGVGR